MKINKELFNKLSKEFEEKNVENDNPCETCCVSNCGGQPLAACSQWIPKFRGEV